MELLKMLESEDSISFSSFLMAISKRIGSLVPLFKDEQYKNSKDAGFGSRFVLSDKRCIRFNWDTEGAVGNVLKIKSIDIFNKTHSPSYTITTNKIPFVSAIPSLCKIFQEPRCGKVLITGTPTFVFETFGNAIDMSAIKILTELMIRFKKGETINREGFIEDYHMLHVSIFDSVISAFKTKFKKTDAGYTLKDPDMAAEILDKMKGDSGDLIVSTGGTKEVYLGDDVAIDDNKVSFADTLVHLNGLVKGIIAGAFNVLFITGKGGIGKTESVERALKDAGLRDGEGYERVAGTASAPGIYTILYHHRHSVIVFDDSDKALLDNESRNIIKAATDTRKQRKISWSKKSSFIYSPSSENFEEYGREDHMAPSSFNFFGRIIFISNLPMSKLDPDGSLRTRAFFINVNPSDPEILDHMQEILMDIRLENGKSLNKDQRMHVLDIVKTSTGAGGLSLRKLVRALNLAASDAPNWEELVKLYS